ncbi:MAG: DNA polymerase III [Treponema sp.]|jgi:DNA polymerase-3 subunit gamma/tau|nr:DNA polymerase III [Treponema sp.]
MFENVIGQDAVDQLALDISSRTLAPSMLFLGKPASGKGTAALETARVLSCLNTGKAEGPPKQLFPFNCSCSSCVRHRLLLHPDLLQLGGRPFLAEISASFAAFRRENGKGGARVLFIRSIRKLLARFSLVLWEDDTRLSKISPLVAALEEDLDEFEYLENSQDEEKLKKSGEALIKHALKLEAEGIREYIPVGHVRRAAYWTRIGPLGRRKILIIENADRMLDEARNSLLKILEEPPETVSIILTSSHEEVLLPTILSRLRPYRFTARTEAQEAEVLRRVFRDTPAAGPGGTEGRITVYLESFLPVSPEKMRPLAAYFAAGAAQSAAITLRKRNLAIPETVVLLGKYTVPVAEQAGLGRPPQLINEAAVKVLKEADNFESRSLFGRFLDSLLALSSQSQRQESAMPAGSEAGLLSCQAVPFLEACHKAAAEAGTAVLVYNQSPALALDRLGWELTHAMMRIGSAVLSTRNH